VIKTDTPALTSSPQVYSDLGGLQNIKSLAHHDKNAALKEISHQFESVMVQMMMKSMRQANAVFSQDDPANSNEMQMYQDMFDNQLSVSLTQGRGMGIATAFMQQLQGRFGTPDAAKSVDPTQAIKSAAASNSLLRPHASSMLNADSLNRAWGGATASDNATNANDGTYEQLLALMSAPEAPTYADAASLDGTPQQFVDALMPVAEQVSGQLGVDSRVLLSQAALETGWGEKVIRDGAGKSSFNFFNIKADSSWQGPVVTVPTLEYRNGVAVRENAAFRAYSSPQESFADYAKLISTNPRYQDALANAGDPSAYVHALQRAGYATDPQYAQKVMSVFGSDSLQQSAVVVVNVAATNTTTIADKSR